jgi:hypothetical protein
VENSLKERANAIHKDIRDNNWAEIWNTWENIPVCSLAVANLQIYEVLNLLIRQGRMPREWDGADTMIITGLIIHEPLGQVSFYYRILSPVLVSISRQYISCVKGDTFSWVRPLRPAKWTKSANKGIMSGKKLIYQGMDWENYSNGLGPNSWVIKADNNVSQNRSKAWNEESQVHGLTFSAASCSSTLHEAGQRAERCSKLVRSIAISNKDSQGWTYKQERASNFPHAVWLGQRRFLREIKIVNTSVSRNL